MQTEPTTTAPRTGDLPFVSVILPIYNEAGFIEPCVQSLLDNTYPRDRMEVLIIDGGSTDGTRDIASRLAERDSRVRLLDNPHKFLAPGINIGIQAARGELLTRMDGHAKVTPDFLQRSVETAGAHPEAWVVGGPVQTIGENFMGNVIGAAMSVPVGVGDAAYRLGNVEGYVEAVLFGTYRRQAFAQVGLLDEGMIRTEDDDLHLRIRRAGGKIYITPAIRSYHYARNSLGRVARQYFQYGYWRIPIILKHGEIINLRKIVPLVFILAWVALIVGSLIWTPLAYALLAFAGLYVLGLLAGALMAIRKRGLAIGICTPLVFPLLHFGYGLGSLLATIRFVLLRRPYSGDRGGTSLTR
jgi:GT2 family glycosyltransferase